MDNRDSSVSAAASAAGKDGSAEEDGLLSVTAGLAKEAAVLFQSRRYSECIDVLKQLLQKKEDDPKILHNIAVAEHCHDGCPDPKKLLDVFDKVKKRSEDLARKSGEQMEATNNNLGTNVTSGSRGSSSTLYQLSAANASRIAYVDEFDTSVVTFNTAVILYNLRDYANALSVLEPLYQNLEPIDESTALNVCLLLLDAALSSQDASKAADVIQYLEKSFGVSSLSNQSDGSLQQLLLNQFKAAGTSNIAASDASSSDSSASANAAENPLVGNLSDEALEYETLYSTLDGGNQNLGRPTSNDHSKTSADWAATATDLKLKMHLYKVRILLLTRNLKTAKRELKLAMNMVRGRDSSTELLLKSQLEYARGNHRKAIKLLDTISNRTEPVMLSMYNNNIGCILHQQRSHHTSNWFFNKALRHSLLIRSEKPLKLAALSQDKSCLIAYNCGLQHLVCGKPLAAARCFRQAIPVFSNRPLFWLRFAECCLLALDKGLLSASSDEDIKVHVAGLGKWRQLVVDYVNSRYSNSDSTAGDDVTNGDDQTLISLPFARCCLLNAQLLLDAWDRNMMKVDASDFALDLSDPDQGASINLKNSNQKNLLSRDLKTLNSTSASAASGVNCDPKETKGGTSSNITLQISVAGYEDVRRKENHRIRQAVLGDLAYVGLCLEDHLKALVAAKSLQQLPDCSKMYLFLGHVYAAEALCCLNRPKEAAEQLSVYIADGHNVELPYANEDNEKWINEKAADYDESNGSLTAKTTGEGTKTTAEESRDVGFLKPDEARGALYVNLAAMSAMQGNLEQASHFAKQGLSSLPNNPRVLLAAVYVDLLQGKTQEALTKLRKCRRVRFLCSTAKMSS